MRWRRRDWPEREPRPEARTLLDEEKTTLLATMTKEVAASPVLMGLGLQVRSQRGRFYLERPLGEGDSGGVEAWGRITPLADSADLLLEQEGRKGSWSEIGRGSAHTLIYACRDGRWGAYRIRPSESRDIASAEAWLVKRKWRQ